MVFVLYIKDLPEGSSRREFIGRPEDFSLNYDEIEVIGNIVVSAEITRSGEQIIFRGKLSAPVKLTCSRCAEEFEKTVVSDLVFVLSMVPVQTEDVEEDDSTDDYYFIPEGSLEFDFGEQVRERLILAVELKPLCRKNCKGICSVCGKNLNLEECSCVKEKIDERWLPLKDLTDRS